MKMLDSIWREHVHGLCIASIWKSIRFARINGLSEISPSRWKRGDILMGNSLMHRYVSTQLGDAT